MCQLREVSLSEKSTFNYVLQEDILSFIQESFRNKYTGIIDFVSSGNISFHQIAQMLGKQVKFGKYTYETPILPNQSLVQVFPTAAFSSKENIQRYLGNKK